MSDDKQNECQLKPWEPYTDVAEFGGRNYQKIAKKLDRLDDFLFNACHRANEIYLRNRMK